MEQRAKPLMCWFEPFVKLMAPKMFNLRHDPFESATFAQFPPRQKPAAFNLDAALRQIEEAARSANR
jgi:arylsulfatase